PMTTRTSRSHWRASGPGSASALWATRSWRTPWHPVSSTTSARSLGSRRPPDASMIADAYDTILFDLDGVLYRGEEAVPGAAGTVAALRTLGKRIAFVTNNSSRTPDAIARHLGSLG